MDVAHGLAGARCARGGAQQVKAMPQEEAYRGCTALPSRPGWHCGPARPPCWMRRGYLEPFHDPRWMRCRRCGRMATAGSSTAQSVRAATQGRSNPHGRAQGVVCSRPKANLQVAWGDLPVLAVRMVRIAFQQAIDPHG